MLTLRDEGQYSSLLYLQRISGFITDGGASLFSKKEDVEYSDEDSKFPFEIFDSLREDLVVKFYETVAPAFREVFGDDVGQPIFTLLREHLVRDLHSAMQRQEVLITMTRSNPRFYHRPYDFQEELPLDPHQ